MSFQDRDLHCSDMLAGGDQKQIPYLFSQRPMQWIVVAGIAHAFDFSGGSLIHKRS